ncbi:BAG family molecular chaperone regulator 8, chloroplastic [Arachis duranensis]|uniref:BAG family molecular chaperone regulator 8, chloroplastic n=1 Tax=Arachis duranensis TaxID=130453 RepID=A0A6P4D7U1_ARADU|nr:BAG family molecular chaperone regulator 8, chloroplastic [Arachis duranensis]
MASPYYNNHHHHHHHNQPPPPPPPPSCTHCCCNPPTATYTYTCCTTSPPPQPQDHLLQAISSLLSHQQQQPHHHPTIIPRYRSHFPKSHNNILTHQHQHQPQHEPHSSISSLIHRIESLESSLTHHSLSSSSSSSLSLRHAAARVIQTHFRSYLVRRSRTLRDLKRLALIKSTFTSLESSLSHNTHFDFVALSHKVVNLLLQLDSIEGCDPMIVDGKRSISRDLVQFLDSIEGVAVKKHTRCVKAAKSGRVSQRVNKPRDSGDDDERRKLLQNLRGRVERISRLCKLSETNEGDLEHDHGDGVGGNYDYNYDDADGYGDGVANVVVPPKKNGVFVVQKQGFQPRVKKSVKFAENGKICEVYSGSSASYEPDLSEDVACLDGSSSSDYDQGEVSEIVGNAAEDVAVDSSQGAEDDEEEAALVENGGSSRSSDDGRRNPNIRGIKNNGRNVVNQGHQERILFSAPMPVKMENKAELMKSKGVSFFT